MIKVQQVLKYCNGLEERLKAPDPILMGDCNCHKCRDERFMKTINGIFDPFIEYFNGVIGIIDEEDEYCRRTFGFNRHMSRNTLIQILRKLRDILDTNVVRHKTVPNRKKEFCNDCGLLCNRKFMNKVKTPRKERAYVCKRCTESMYRICDECGIDKRQNELHTYRMLTNAKVMSFPRKLMCKSCAHDYVYCSACRNLGKEEHFESELIPKRKNPRPFAPRAAAVADLQLAHPSWRDKNRACKHCYPNLFRKCEECKEKFPKWNIREWHDNENDKMHIYCEKCHIWSVPMHQYNYKPPTLTWLYDKETEQMNVRLLKNRLWFGVEFEFDRETARSNITRNNVIKSCKSYFDAGSLYCTYDGTIRNGFEIVTMPMTYAWFKKNLDRFKGMLKTAIKHGYDGSRTTCGGHIHMSKDAFTSLHIYKFCRFVYDSDHRNFIHLISERGAQFDNDMSFFSIEDTEEEGIKFAAKNKTFKSADHHSALSFQGQDPTIEARFFAGYSRIEQLQKNIEFLQSLYIFSKSVSVRNLTLEKYLRYILSRTECNKYTNLNKFLYDNRLKMSLKKYISIIKQFKGGKK